MTKKPTVALIYDFDGTLAPGNMQEFGFIQAIGKGIDEFWKDCNSLAEENDANQILAFMYKMLEKAKNNRISLRRESFRKFGSMVKLYPGVTRWFALVNKLGEELGLEMKHYINSSGLKEMIEGTAIASEFDQLYCSSYLYDVDGIAYWPASAVDYTTKTQFLFKINKGIKEIRDTTRINQYMPEAQRPVPFKRMIYFGDGMTDIPCMSMIKHNGGHSIAVYGEDAHREMSLKLIREDRVNFVCKADYRKGQEMYEVIKRILQKIKADAEFEHLLDIHRQRAE